MIKKIIKTQIFKITSLVILVGLIVLFTVDQWAGFGQKIKQISPDAIIYISLLFICSQIINGYMLKVYIQVFGIKLLFKEWFGLISLQSFGNYLPLSAGLASNIAYLKVQKKLPVSDYISYVGGDTVLKFLTFGIIGILVSLFYLVSGSEVDFRILIIFCGLVIIALIIIWVKIPKQAPQYKILKLLLSIHNGWEQIKSNKAVVIKSISAHTLMLAIIGLQFRIIFDQLGYEVGFLPIILLTILTNVIRVASIFPGNLGLRESVSGIITELFGLSFSLGVFGSIVGRVISMFWIFLFGIIYSYVLIIVRKVNK